MKTERKMNWLCIYCHNLLEGSVTIDIPSKDFVDPEGTYNCCNLYCDNCKEITAHINVDAGMGKLVQLLNSHHFITDNSCEGHAVLSRNFDPLKKHESDGAFIGYLLENIDFRYPYFCIQDSECIDNEGYFGRVPTYEMFKIFRDSGFNNIRFTYYSGPDATTGEYTREEINRSISTKHMNYKELAYIADLYERRHGRDLRISYSLSNTADYAIGKLVSRLILDTDGNPNCDTANYLISTMSTYFKKRIKMLYNRLVSYFDNEGEVELRRLPTISVRDVVNEMMKDKEETQ